MTLKDKEIGEIRQIKLLIQVFVNKFKLLEIKRSKADLGLLFTLAGWLLVLVVNWVWVEAHLN